MKNKNLNLDLKEFILKINYNFKNFDYLNLALTHSSFSEKNVNYNYERLEFLGDRVLGLIIANLIYKKFPNEDEGSLSKRFSDLVSKKSLIIIARKIGIIKLLKTSKEFGHNIKITETMLSDSVEALIGAIFLDSHYDEVKKVIEKLWIPILNMQSSPPINPKSFLQEWCLKKQRSLPIYKVIKKKGPDHEPTFLVELEIKDFLKVSSEGQSKQDAEIKAANIILNKIF